MVLEFTLLVVAMGSLYRALQLRRRRGPRRNMVWALLVGVVGLAGRLLSVALRLARRSPGKAVIVLVLLLAAVSGSTASPLVDDRPGGSTPVTASAGADLAAQVGYNAGWRGETLVEAVAYAGIESNWRRDAVSSTGCIGIWQLCPARQEDFDPQTNANRAHGKWAGCRGGSFDCDWTPYDLGRANPAWPMDYASALQAVAQLPNHGN